MLKSQPPVSVKGVAAIGAIVTLAALTGCVTRTKEVVVERPTQPATIVVQQPATAPANVRTMPGPINEQRGVSPGAGYSWLTGYWAWDGVRWVWQPGRWIQGAAPAIPAPQAETMGNAPHATAYWVPGYWAYNTSSNTWVWTPGAWRN